MNDGLNSMMNLLQRRQKTSLHVQAATTCPGCNKVFNTLDDYADHPCTSRQHSTKKTQDTITCRACYKVFNVLKDYADHRCAKPPAHVGKGKYMLLTLGKYMLLTLGKYMLLKVNNYMILIHALLFR